MGGHGLDSAGLGQGQIVRSCEHSIELLGCVKCGEFLDWLRVH
jgi:hypothetical protein